MKKPIIAIMYDFDKTLCTRDMQEYLDSWEEKDLTGIRRNIVPDTRRSQIEEFMFLGLRLMRGVSKIEFEQRFEIAMEELYGSVIENYLAQGLLTWQQEYLALTEAGIDVSNTIMADFLLDDEKPS